MKAKLFTAAGAVLLIAALAACSPKAPSADASSMAAETSASSMPAMSGMSDMSGMAMHTDANAKMGSGTGVITAIDQAKGTVTIKHGAIPAVGWPAMTMTFKANPPSVLDKVKIGEEIAFDVSVKGSDAEVTAITAKIVK